MPLSTSTNFHANKHQSFNVPASAPVTPAYSRHHHPSSDGPPPVTPQRIPRSQRHQTQLQNYFNSPFTPSSTLSTPYTPLGLRTPWSNNSALTTPGSVSSGKHRHDYENSFESPLHERDRKGRADNTDDWRSRANENGIRVTHGAHARYDDDEIISAPPLFSAAPRRPRAHTQVLHSPPPVAPAQPHTPARRTLAALNTPSPRASNVDRLKLKGSLTDPAYSRRRPAFGQSDLFDIEENEYAAYPPIFPAQPLALPLALNDPFDGSGFPGIGDSLHKLSRFHVPDPIRHEVPPPPPRDDACPVCGNSSASRVELLPCEHVLCSGCFTSSLNIVGEKTMECAVCHQGVESFHMRTVAGPRSTPLQFNPDFDSMFEPERPNFFELQRSSTPVGMTSRSRTGESPVLRIDNVPWDITPPAIRSWLKHPVKRVHVLLDRKGKTQSHAFVEMVDEEAARAALRTAQNSVLGRGKRARGVTVTRSGQQELMKALFPAWRGHFDGEKPSIMGMGEADQIAALSVGLVEDVELRSLLHLIRAPDSHFLKVPSLPFHSLISMLSKFPGSPDSRQFWTPTTRDLLFDITFAAIQILATDDGKRRDLNDPELLAQLLHVAIHCDAFTIEQRATLANLVDTSPIMMSPASSVSGLSAVTDLSSPDAHVLRSMQYSQQHPPQQPYRQLAREFGVDPHVVEALAQRLSGIC
ncbi:hypothetical protein OF83DRAFT_1176322 [Amylostereum chailletii]|nr:hypothetical protein OF83DRAFT_1176322 [Amylostereum chailletii]